MLTREQRNEFREALAHKRAEVEKKIAAYKELTRPIAPENAIGRVSRMDAINNKSVNEAALRQAEATLTKLTLAESKLDQPDFGTCARCNGPIPTGRLMLMPESNRCVRCAQ